MRRMVGHLTTASHGMKALYSLVFTSIVLYELVRHTWRKRHAEVSHNRGRGRRSGNRGPLAP